jgi:hypothetical protein
MAVAFRSAVIEREIDHPAIEQGCCQRLPASASSSNCRRSLEVSAQRLDGHAALEFAPASKKTGPTRR